MAEALKLLKPWIFGISINGPKTEKKWNHWKKNIQRLHNGLRGSWGSEQVGCANDFVVHCL